MATEKILKCLRCCCELAPNIKYLCEPCSLVMDWRTPQPTPTRNPYGNGVSQRVYVNRPHFDDDMANAFRVRNAPTPVISEQEQESYIQLSQLYEYIQNTTPTRLNQENIRYSTSNSTINSDGESITIPPF